MGGVLILRRSLSAIGMTALMELFFVCVEIGLRVHGSATTPSSVGLRLTPPPLLGSAQGRQGVGSFCIL